MRLPESIPKYPSETKEQTREVIRDRAGLKIEAVVMDRPMFMTSAQRSWFTLMHFSIKNVKSSSCVVSNIQTKAVQIQVYNTGPTNVAV